MTERVFREVIDDATYNPQYPQNNVNMDVVNVEMVLKQWETYQKVTQVLLDDSDYQKIGNQRFKKKSAWRKYMRAFNISTTILEKEIKHDEDGRVVEANFLVKAISPDGRSAEGFGNCSIKERRFSKPNHDIPATAMTRAVNRAVSDLIGAGEVSAEEINHDDIRGNGCVTRRKMSKNDPLPSEEVDELIRTVERDV